MGDFKQHELTCFKGFPDALDRPVATGTEGRSLTGLVDAAIEIARGRRETLHHLRAALEVHDDATALRFARKLCGLEK